MSKSVFTLYIVSKVLLSVLSEVIAELKKRNVSVETPEQMAMKATEQCFNKFDKNHDHKLNRDEFRLWFNSDVF